MKYLCSICARRSADTMHAIDGKHRPVCMSCIGDEVPDPGAHDLRRVHGDVVGSPGEIIFAAVRDNPGATFVELREVLNMAGGGNPKIGPRTDEARTANTYSAALMRLHRQGRVIREGAWPNFTYRVAEVMKRRAA